jgi:thiosulfate dehydrogenase
MPGRLLAENKTSSAVGTKEIVTMIKGRSDYHQPPTEETIPNDRYGDDVRLGMNIFSRTNEYASRYTGNDLVCTNCHLDKGRKANAAPLWAAYGMYPSYRKKNDQNNSFEERIQQCFRFSMNGFAPALDAPEIKALVSYAHFLATGAPVGIELPGRGFPQIINTGFDANPTRGSEAYKAKCASCHGAEGKGQQSTEGKKNYPPLWGMNSYNKGSGLANDALLAGFIRANMPLGKEWTLTDQEALDLAAYINLQIRPWDPRKGLMKGLLD